MKKYILLYSPAAYVTKHTATLRLAALSLTNLVLCCCY